MPEHAPPFVLPELTRSLRHFAMPGALGPDHARYFAPLLAARRAAHEAGLWTGRLAAFDARRLRGAWMEMLGALAGARFPRSGAGQRAMTAELEEYAVPVFAALDELASAAEVVRVAPDDTVRLAAWNAWVGALREVFAAADDAWAATSQVLIGSRVARGGWWRGRAGRR